MIIDIFTSETFRTVCGTVIVAVTPFIIRYLRSHADMADAIAAHATDQRTALLKQGEAYLLNKAANVVAVEAPLVTAQVQQLVNAVVPHLTPLEKQAFNGDIAK